jgi:hypothetical protein
MNGEKDPLLPFRSKEELTSKDFPILSFGIPYEKLNEREGTIEFKFRAWTDISDLFEGPRIKIIDIPVGENKRLIFERTLDWFCFIHVDHSKKRITEARLPHRLFDPFTQYHVFLVWSPTKIGLAIGNVGKDNLEQVWVPC